MTEIEYNQLRLLNTLSKAVNVHLGEPKDLIELGRGLEINETEAKTIYKNLVSKSLITPYGRGTTSRITAAGSQLIGNRDQLSDKELILEILSYMTNVAHYYVDIYFESTAVDSIFKIDHLLQIMLEHKLVTPTSKPNNKYTVMPNHKGQTLTSEGYDMLFKKKEPNIIQQINSQTYIAGNNITHVKGTSDENQLTGTNTNEYIRRKVLKYLYDRRDLGMINLNEFWRKYPNEKYIRNTIQVLSTEGYLLSFNHRSIGNILGGITQTLDNVSVTAKITDKGIKYYREFYKDQWNNHWWVKVITIVGTIVGIIIALVQFWPK